MARKSIKVLDQKMGPARVEKARAKARELMAEMVLAELRKEAGMTQAQLAKAMGVSQAAVSGLEAQNDMQISTLKRVVKALGGQMHIEITMAGETYQFAGC